MKKILILLVVFFASYGYAQEKIIEIDYTVDYLIANNKRQSMDTISIGYSKNGKYLWTDYNELAQEFYKSLFKNSAYKDASVNIVLDTESADIYFSFEDKGNLMFFKVNLNSFIPKGGSGSKEDSIDLISNKTDSLVSILDNKYPEYEIYPSDKPTDKILVTFDESISINNNDLLKKVFEIAVKMSKENGNLTLDIPNGLILKVNDGRKNLIEAIKISPLKKIISINYSFKITE